MSIWTTRSINSTAAAADSASVNSGGSKPWNRNTDQVARDLLEALHDEELHDVSLISAQGQAITACRFVLAARSRVLKRMLYGSFREAKSQTIGMMGYESCIIRAVVHYCATNSIPPDFLEQPSPDASCRRSNNSNADSRESRGLDDEKDQDDENKTSSYLCACPVETIVRRLVRLEKAADYLELPGLQEQASYLCRGMMSEHPPLSCAVFDEADIDTSLSVAAMRIIECRPYVALDTVIVNRQSTMTTSSSANRTVMVTGGGVESLRPDRIVDMVQNLNIGVGELFLFQMVRRWFDHTMQSFAPDDPQNDAFAVARQCTRYLQLENIEPQTLFSSQIQQCPFVSPDRIFEAVAKQALRASQDRVWSLRCRGKESIERVLVEGAGSRDANGMYYRIPGLANGELYTKRELACGQQRVYTLSCSSNTKGQFECRIFCSKLLTHRAVPSLQAMLETAAVVDPVFQPVVQVVSLKRPEPGAQHGLMKFHQLELSDGNCTMPGCLAAILNPLVEKGDLVENCVIKLVDFAIFEMEGIAGIQIKKLSMISSTSGYRFGAPQRYRKKESSSLSGQELSSQLFARSNDDDCGDLQNLYTCSYPMEQQAKDTKIPRDGWKPDEHGFEPSPVCTWIPAVADRSSSPGSGSGRRSSSITRCPSRDSSV